MKNKNIILLLLGVVLVSVGIYNLTLNKRATEEAQNENTQEITDKSSVNDLVENFGEELKNLSLLAPTVSEDIRELYTDYVTPDLLNHWVNNPEEAPGRTTSSPWPERIEIVSTEPTSEVTYIVSGYIVEMTSVDDQGLTGVSVTINVDKTTDGWRISNFNSERVEE